MDGGVAEVIATPMSDSDIKEYLPDARIIKYSELAKYPDLHAVLPEVESFCFLLYEDTPNKGHWVVISRPKEGVAEYFDSYGGQPDAPLRWTPIGRRVALGQGKPYLSMLLEKSPDEIVYNKVKYQKDGGTVNDCGRWCVLRTLRMKAGEDLNQFYRFVDKEDKKYPGDKDAFVSHMIP